MLLTDEAVYFQKKCQDVGIFMVEESIRPPDTNIHTFLGLKTPGYLIPKYLWVCSTTGVLMRIMIC